MTTVTLHPGTPTAIGGADAHGSIVGTGAIWADASDATYMSSVSGTDTRSDYVARATVDTLSVPAGATVTGVTVRMRAQAMTGTGTPARVASSLVLISDTSHPIGFGDDPTTGGWTVTPTGSILDFSLDITDTLLATFGSFTFADFVDYLIAGAYIDLRSLAVFPFTTDVTIRVYEYAFDVTYTTPATAVPPLRLINRGGDQFSSAWAAVGHQRTRQGGNRQLGIL